VLSLFKEFRKLHVYAYDAPWSRTKTKTKTVYFRTTRARGCKFWISMYTNRALLALDMLCSNQIRNQGTYMACSLDWKIISSRSSVRRILLLVSARSALARF